MENVLAVSGTSSNRYTIVARLGGGGMAEIFLARAMSDAGVERHVVLKRVIAEHSRDPRYAKIFLDEARIAAQLHHPNIAQVHDIGVISGSYFFTMEYVHGVDIRHVMKQLHARGMQMPIKHALGIATGVLAALHYAHQASTVDGKRLGIVHRDVSPSNIMITFDGAVKLVDFGVAKAAERFEETRSGMLKGSRSSMRVRA